MVYHRVITEKPPNTGVRIEGLTGESLTQSQMYVRTSFMPPLSPPGGFDLIVPRRKPRYITVEQFVPFEEVHRDIVLECAGNGRTFMKPVPHGVPWALDGVSPITVGGYRLADVLGSVPDEVSEFVFTGADSGTVPAGRKVSYQFSISRELAMSGVPILTTHIGGEPLTLMHGAPIRLIVPGHYAMKSVKWLIRVEGVTTPFRGPFVEKYRYYGDTVEPEGGPVGEIAVRSIISSPLDGEPVSAGATEIRGAAWAGESEVSKVEVSIDGGETWQQADLVRRQTGGRWAPIRWAYTAEPDPGPLVIMARATDEAGNTQPLESRWNRGGFANNVVQRVRVRVVEP